MKKNKTPNKQVYNCFQKIVFQVFILTFISVFAYAQNSKDQVMLTVTGNSITYAQAFKDIKKSTGLTVFYNNEIIDDTKKVPVSFTSASLSTLLRFMFAKTDISYEIKREKVIILTKKGASGAGLKNQNGNSILKGKVVDEETGESLIGVVVAAKGATSKMTLTDKNGNFSISINKNDVLSFSYLGYASKDVIPANIKDGTVKLSTSASSLDEVVVIGYGSTKKSDLTGSVGIVNVKEINKAPVATFDQALAGRIAGVQVTSDEGQPGSAMNIVIRGGNSLTQSNSPLYVIDGFPMEDPSMTSLSPQDIKSITILKDASATAIYGSRGANGVVVIETKDGKVGKTTFAYDTYYGQQQVTQRMEVMSPYEFVKYQAEFDPTYAQNVYLVNGLTVEDYRDTVGIDWQDKLFRNGSVQNHNLSINGGNTSTKFSISGNVINQDGAIINSGFNRYQGRAYLSHSPNKKLHFNLHLNYSNDKSYGDFASAATSGTQPYSSYLLYRVWGYRTLNGPNRGSDLEESFIDEDGNDSRFNPIIDYTNSIRERSNENFNTSGNAWYKLRNDLTLKVKGGINRRAMQENSFYNSLTSRGSAFSSGNTKGVNGAVRFSNYQSWINENTLTYRPKVKKGHKLTALMGWTIQGDQIRRFGLAGEQIPNELLGIYGLEEGIPGANTAYDTHNMLMSYLGRVDYNINDKYLFTGTFRSDGSSKFIKENRWSYFPSAAFAWRLKNENFLKTNKIVSDAKLRLSYGLTGNNRIDNFGIYSKMTLPYSAYYSFGDVVNTGIELSTFGNKDLKWETTKQFDAGLDISFFNNRVNVILDVYDKVTSDLLLYANVPYTSGYSRIYKNIGKVRNKGLEFSLSTINVKTKDFSWESDFNISFNKNEILALAEDETRLLNPVWWANYGNINLFIAEVGGPIAQFYGLIWDGLYQPEDFSWQNNSDASIAHGDRNYELKNDQPSNGSSRSTIKPGDIKYVDVNEDGIVNGLDNVIIGRGLPIHTGGLNNNFSYKNFSLSVFLQWSYGNHIMNANRIYMEGNDANRSALNQFASYADRWTFENQDSNIPRAMGQGPSGTYSTRTLEDGSYLRLKTVSFAYSMPESVTKKLRVDNLSIYASAQNLFTWTKYSGMDPEVSTRNSSLTPGLDYSSYPRMRIFTVGLKTSF